MIETGDQIPSIPVKLVTADGVVDATTDAILGKGRVVLFGLPGAFTPTCDTSHLPGFVSNANKFADLGVNRLVCATANDYHVTKAWAERSEALGAVDFIADPWAKFAKALGLEKDFPDLGQRYKRFAMLIEDGTVKNLFVQDVAGVTVSGAPALLMVLQANELA